MHGFRQAVKVRAQRIGQRLCFIVIVETGQLTPTGVMPEFDKPGSELCAKKHPAKGQNRHQ